MASSRAIYLKELQVNRINSVDIDADLLGDKVRGGSARERERRYRRTTGEWSRRRSDIQTWKRRSSRKRATSGGRLNGSEMDKLPVLRNGSGNTTSNQTETTEAEDNGVVFYGMLHKTTRTKVTLNLKRNHHGHRQYRRFQLTERALEYSQVLQRVRIRKQFPLTSIADIIYKKDENPVAFKLVFQNTEMLLEASDEHNCILWVDAIRREWHKWNVAPLCAKPTNTRLPSELEESTTIFGDAGVRGSYLEENQGYFKTGKEVAALSSPAQVSSPKDTDEIFKMAQTQLLPSIMVDTDPTVPKRYLRHETGHLEADMRQNPTQGGFARRIGLAPRLYRSNWDELQKKIDKGEKDFAKLHELDFIMIKYPRKGRSIPHERVFTMDYENLLLMWRRTASSKLTYLHTLPTECIIEVREGQNSDGFDRYPYEEVNGQSFSVLVEGEKQAGPTNKTYAVLQSLDLICDSPQEQKLWCQALKSFISPKRHLFSSRYEFTDPTIIWLKSHWIILAEGGSEIREEIAFSFGKSLVPQMHGDTLQSHLDTAHQFQLRESLHHGSSLHWDGFILFFNLLCGIAQPDCPLFEIFQDYARDYPSLGMTVEEFKKFLIEHQGWFPKDALDSRCDQLMRRYDYHHRAFKMYMAKGKPMEFHISVRLFSFAGFLSFVRSVDNCVINREHEDVYQDMDQPLSHYFINSSHNTYLEGHQLTGRSTIDAYVRALLQGCRCLELDCWDGPNGEPKITHGNTLVSELSLEEVTQAIDEYAFHTSNYPLILSLENHCCKAQQVRMAKIFQDIFGTKLVKDNWVDQEGLDRLPSPLRLQGKIILKGTEKSKQEGRGLSSAVPKLFSNSSTPKQTPQTRRPSDLAASTENVFQYPPTYQADTNNEEIEERPEYEQEELHEDLDKLIVYCRSKHIRPWNWEEQQNTAVYNLFSFSESSASSKCKYSTEMLACTERQLVRTYPSGFRTDSSNYDPIPMWNHGIHMVALNVQTPDWPMYLNQGKFRQNGGCGYILKPKVMRDPDQKEYSPHMTGPHHAVTPVNFEITLLSGQHLIKPSKLTTSMEVLYQTYGIPHDCEQKRYTISSNDTNPLWPQFGHTPRLEKTILMPELCLVLFAVYIRVHRKLAGTKQVLLGQNVFPLSSLKSGLRFIPLRKPGGESISHIGIFVKIGINVLRHKQASSSGKCATVESPIHKFTMSNLSETCHISQSLEDTTIVEQLDFAKEDNDDKTTCLVSDGTINGGPTFSRGQPQLFRQGAVVVEVHANYNTQEDDDDSTHV